MAPVKEDCDPFDFPIHCDPFDSEGQDQSSADEIEVLFIYTILQLIIFLSVCLASNFDMYLNHNEKFRCFLVSVTAAVTPPI